MPSPEERVEALARKIASLSLSDEKIKIAVFAETLSELDDSDIVETLRVVLEKGDLRIERYMTLVKLLGHLSDIMKKIGSRKMSGVYSLSRTRGYDDVTRLLKDIPARRNVDDVPGDVYVDPKLREVSLGMKKTMGRLGDRDLVNRLLHDQHPDVIEQVLNNPGLTEEQVVKMAAKRPTSAAVLRGISLNVKWMARYNVRKSLVFNPFTPTEIGVRMVGALLRQDIAEVARDTSLHGELRSAASRIIKGGNKPKPDDEGEGSSSA